MSDLNQRDVDRFNKQVPPGTKIRYWTMDRSGPGAVGRTRGLAYFRNGLAKVQVTGWGGGIRLTHVEVQDWPDELAAVHCWGCGRAAHDSLDFGPMASHLCGMCWNIGLRVVHGELVADVDSLLHATRQAMPHWADHINVVELHNRKDRQP